MDENRMKEQAQMNERKHEVAIQLRRDEGVKKKSCLRSCGLGIFGTRLLVSKYDREAYIRTTLCELCVYAVYLTVTCLVTYGMTTTSAYYYTNVISHLFLDTPFGDEWKTFRTSTTVDDFWEFTESTMTKGLYWKYWYGVVDPKYVVPPKHQGILHENRLLGRPRLRQIRVTSESCPISDKFRRLVRECYPAYSTNHEDKGNYHNLFTTSEDAWNYHSEKELNGTSHWGRLATYSGAGAFQLLGSEDAETKQIVNELKNNLWINRATRVVFLDFTMYNANVNLFCIVKLVWEMPPTGGLITSWSIRTIRLIRYTTYYDYFILCLEFVFVLFTIYYTLQEIFEWVTASCENYSNDFWSYLDMSILTMSYICIGFSIYRHCLISYSLEALLADPNAYTNFYWLGFWETQYNNVVAVNVFLAWVKVFKYISFNRTMSQLSSTMSRCAKDVGGFAIMFFIVFFAFAQLGYLLFGSQVEDFRTFQETAFSLLRLILGDFNYRAIENANRILGPIFFVTYVFFVFFVLLNMFLAIINDTYSQVKAEVHSHPEEYQVTDYLKRGLGELCGCMSAKEEARNRVKLANSENVITNEEIRENLRKSEYTDMEIEMFLTRYELDEERPMDADEAENVLGSLEGYHSVDGRGDEVPVTTNVRRSIRKSLQPQGQAESSLTNEEISELQTRVGMLESSLSGVTRKMDSLLTKLESLGHDEMMRASVRAGSVSSRGRRSSAGAENLFQEHLY